MSLLELYERIAWCKDFLKARGGGKDKAPEWDDEYEVD